MVVYFAIMAEAFKAPAIITSDSLLQGSFPFSCSCSFSCYLILLDILVIFP